MCAARGGGDFGSRRRGGSIGDFQRSVGAVFGNPGEWVGQGDYLMEGCGFTNRLGSVPACVGCMHKRDMLRSTPGQAARGPEGRPCFGESACPSPGAQHAVCHAVSDSVCSLRRCLTSYSRSSKALHGQDSIYSTAHPRQVHLTLVLSMYL